MKISFVLTAALCALLITQSQAIKCYGCADLSGKECTGTEIDCTSVVSTCMKMLISGTPAGGGFIRSCGNDIYNSFKFDSAGYLKVESVGGLKAEYWRCDKDLCNNSMLLRITSVLVVIAAFFAYI